VVRSRLEPSTESSSNLVLVPADVPAGAVQRDTPRWLAAQARSSVARICRTAVILCGSTCPALMDSRTSHDSSITRPPSIRAAKINKDPNNPHLTAWSPTAAQPGQHRILRLNHPSVAEDMPSDEGNFRGPCHSHSEPYSALSLLIIIKAGGAGTGEPSN